MQAVKLTLLLIVLFISSFDQSTAQTTITGQYTGNNRLDYQFTDSSFVVTAYDHIEMQRKAGGFYELSGDTLILEYKPMKDPSPSRYEITSKERFDVPLGMQPTERDTNSIMTDLKIVDYDGQPLQEPILILRNKKDEVVMSFSSDTAGAYPPLHIQDEYIASIKIQSLQFKPISIPTDSLRGYQSQLKVILSKSRTYYSQQKDTLKYIFQKKDEGRVILDGVEKNQRIILQRKDGKE